MECIDGGNDYIHTRAHLSQLSASWPSNFHGEEKC